MSKNKRNLPNYITIHKEDIFITLYVKPNSKMNEIRTDQEEFIVYTKATPLKGKANKSILKIISDYFDISMSSIEIISGFKSTDKTIRISCNDNNIKADIFKKVTK